ncbi:hypothetical protein O6H91_03G049600 [Diphasiastrum complanatum]|uniref:Uncharacterized protein n=1 Tax=Diphasiastrum complanatum TaxID=34168 RepID=A0ACC2E640_DIPCM|nr:hypothetical protein O6H91_03G049600 [Diphasiastrum complanatum]
MGRKLSINQNVCSMFVSSLQILVLLHVEMLVVCGRSLPRNLANGSRHIQSSEGGATEFWSKTLPGLTVPPSVAGRISPLKSADIIKFSTKLQNGSLRASSQEFCSQANLVCDHDLPLLIAEGTVFLGAQDHLPSTEQISCSVEHGTDQRSLALASASSSNVFFPEKELRAGGHITLPDLRDPAPMKAFLPQTLAEKLPFNCHSFDELLAIFNISKSSNTSFDMAMVLKACESPTGEGQFKKCITSLEAMVDLVTSILGQNLELLSEPSTAGSKQTVTVIDVKARESPAAPVSCHSLVFPFAVYYCHYLDRTKAFHLSMQTQNGEMLQRTAVCHSWLPSLTDEFVALKLERHESACHWLYASNLMWLAN